MAPSHREPDHLHRRVKNARRERLRARAAHQHQPSEETNVKRKEEKFENEQKQIAAHERAERPVAELVEQTDPVAASEAAHIALMSSPDAPAWAKVTVRAPVTAAPGTREDVVARMAALDAEQSDLRAKIDKSIEEKRAILNQQLEDQAKGEANLAAARELPNTLKATLQAVEEFESTVDDAPTAVDVDPYEVAAHRGQAALARAMRRSRGENVPEPEPVSASTPSEPKLSTRELALRERIDPALATASALKEKIAEWSSAFGTVFEKFYVVGEDDANREHRLVDQLMRGLPSTTAELQSRSFQLVKSVLATVRQTTQLKNTMVITIDRETLTLKRILARVDRMGPMIVQGDRSSESYDLERELQTSIRDLGTVTEESVAGLWKAAADVQAKLKRIADLRESVAMVPQPPLVWENRGEILHGLDELKRRGMGDGRPTANNRYSPFDPPSRG
jgi:hypothetical protein